MPSPYKSRLEKLGSLIGESCGIIVLDSYNAFYFTGFRGPGIVVHNGAEAFLLVPPLEYLRALKSVEEEDTPIELAVYYPYGLPRGLVLGGSKEPKIIAGGFLEALEKIIGRKNCRLKVDTYPHYIAKSLEKHYELELVGGEIRSLRVVKEAWEIERIEQATRIAEKALSHALASLEEGVSEAEIAGIIEYYIRVEGGEDHAFPPIVCFGENTVYPHYTPRSRRLRRREPVLVDLGAVYKGYNSDMTRSLWHGGSPDRWYVKVAETVLEAVEEAIDALKPGVVLEEVDHIARSVLAREGLDKYFNHSLGHGVGVAIHEEPRISPGNKTPAKEGMVVTIEPGVYIPGRFGVRIEELVVVTSRGARRITRFEQRLW